MDKWYKFSHEWVMRQVVEGAPIFLLLLSLGLPFFDFCMLCFCTAQPNLCTTLSLPLETLCFDRMTVAGGCKIETLKNGW